MRLHVLGLALLLAAWMPLASSHPGTVSLDTRRQGLSRLLADEWEYEMRESPEFATILGDYRYNDRWSDNSLAHVQQQRADLQNWLSRFDGIDTTDFPEHEKLNQVLMVRSLNE